MHRKLNNDIKQQQKGREVYSQRASAVLPENDTVLRARKPEAGEMRGFIHGGKKLQKMLAPLQS